MGLLWDPFMIRNLNIVMMNESIKWKANFTRVKRKFTIIVQYEQYAVVPPYLLGYVP